MVRRALHLCRASSIRRVRSAFCDRPEASHIFGYIEIGGESGEGVDLVDVESAVVRARERSRRGRGPPAPASGRSRRPASGRAPPSPPGDRPESSSSRRSDRRTWRRTNRSRPCGGRGSRPGPTPPDRRCRAPRIRSRARRPPVRSAPCDRTPAPPRTAGASPSGPLTRETPTDEPAFTGLTNSGHPSLAAPASAAAGSRANAAAVTTVKSTTGIPASRRRRLATSLSIPTAEPSTPAPT